MNALYVDPVGGLAGDMLLAALLDAGMPEEALRAALGSLPLTGYELLVREEKRRGFRGCRVDVAVTKHEHAHRHLPDIRGILSNGTLTEGAVSRAVRVFETLARAEAHVHGSTVDAVHFHEVGAVDSIVDIAGIAIALDHLEVMRIAVGRIPFGTGTTTGAHGEFPLPAPATAAMLEGWRVRFTGRPGEHTTPTGAAVVSALADPDFRPALTLGKVGVGFGARNPKEGPVNMVRVLRLHGDDAPEDVDVLEATIDDMTGEEIAFLTDELRRAGARDVFTTPVLMKKGRPGVTVTVLATAGEGAAFADVFFARSTTLGVRIRHETRVTLGRAVHTIDTELGPVRVKVVRGPLGTRMTPEQDDIDAIARARDLPLRDVVARVEAAWRSHPAS